MEKKTKMQRMAELMGMRLEKLDKPHPESPAYELFAPEGQQFIGGEHSMLFGDYRELCDCMQSPSTMETEACPDDCDCKA